MKHSFLPDRWKARVRPAERPAVYEAFFLLFGFTSGHLLLETARDALFLARLPASRLPWVYLGIALATLVLFQKAPAASDSRRARATLVRTLRLAALIVLLLWAAIPFAGTAGYYLLYVWTGVLASLFVVRFWIAAASSFTPSQAKRLYPIIGAGAVLGGIAGAGTAALLAPLVPARMLLVAAATAFGATSLLRPAVGEYDPEVAETATMPLPSAIRLVASHPYLVQVGGLLLLAAVTFTLVDYVFKSAVDVAVAPARLDTFFALTYLGLGVLSLFVQVVGAGWLVRRLGVNRAMAVVPSLILVAALGVAGGLGLVMAVGLKAVDGGLRNSLHRTGAELLFVPLSPHLRARAKPVIDVVGQRGGQAVASLLILAVLALSSSPAVFAALAAVAATAWAMLSLGLRRHYLDVFRASLDDEIAAARWELPPLDLAGLESIVEALASEDERTVSTAADLAVAYGRGRLVPPALLQGRAGGGEVSPPGSGEDAGEAIGPLLEDLADRTRRDHARRALVAKGPGVIARLDEALADDGLAHAVRRQLPYVIAAFGSAPAAARLTDRLAVEEDGMIRFKILRALGRMRRRQPSLPLDVRTLRRERERAIETARHFAHLRHRLERIDDPGIHAGRLLLGLLRDKQAHALERAFRIYNLETSNDDFYRAFRGLESPGRELRSGGQELLEHLVDAERATELLTLMEGAAPPDMHAAPEPRAGAGAPPLAPDSPVTDALLRELASGNSMSIADLAIAFREALHREDTA